MFRPVSRDYINLKRAADALVSLLQRDGIPSREDKAWYFQVETALQAVAREWQNDFPDDSPDDWTLANELCGLRDALAKVSGPMCDSAHQNWVGGGYKQKPTKLKDVQPVCERVAKRLGQLAILVQDRAGRAHDDHED